MENDQLFSSTTCGYIIEQKSDHIVAISLKFNPAIRVEIGQIVTAASGQCIVPPGTEGEVVNILEPYSLDSFGNYRTTDIICISYTDKLDEVCECQIRFEHIVFE